MLRPGFEVGAGLDFAVADIGASGDISSSTLQKPLVIFVWSQQGLMAGVKVEGQKITQLTNECSRAPVRSPEIRIQGPVELEHHP